MYSVQYCIEEGLAVGTQYGEVISHIRSTAHMHIEHIPMMYSTQLMISLVPTSPILVNGVFTAQFSSQYYIHTYIHTYVHFHIGVEEKTPIPIPGDGERDGIHPVLTWDEVHAYPQCDSSSIIYYLTLVYVYIDRKSVV